jgi:hypothetical protein
MGKNGKKSLGLANPFIELQLSYTANFEIGGFHG